MNKVEMFEQKLKETLKKDYPEFSAGDIVKVYYKIRERDKVRLHPIEGIVLKMQGQMHRKSFTLRRIAYGQAYEVTMPYYSPNIDKIELTKKTRRRPRRSKLYYLRGRVGKKAMMA
ncbi:MAG: 50S ribosomal protein L19 [Candidatus Omnitrophica bacterium]|jgi:large subunit ribosomal protein L19|nr:50S ribosomal protein L19 [Candidatus Omnitrophota bacterium]MDD5440964.1 50S ribosomal protein L19 [Candidatus Omnitrophota bacterium]